MHKLLICVQYTQQGWQTSILPAKFKDSEQPAVSKYRYLS